MFNKIAIIGVGLIGGSIGLAAKSKQLAKEVVGVCRHKKSLQLAKQIGAIDRGTLAYKSAVRDADLVVLATPVNQIIKIARRITPHLKKKCLIIDVGSTKSEIVQNLEKIFSRSFYFVGSHPLAGSEKRGVAQAREDLFTDAICILVKTKKTNLAALKTISAFWGKIGSRVEVLAAQKHDKIVALISHLPHLAAVQLVRIAKDNLSFASSGFKDTTRIASSDARIWSDICLTNKKFIVQALNEYIARLEFMRKLIKNGERKKLSKEFETARALRNSLYKK